MHNLLATDHLAVVDLSGTGHYLEWGIIQISYANATVILLMILVFVLALVLPFPGHSTGAQDSPAGPASEPTSPDGGRRS
jgi:hypothetical protein